MRWLSNGVDMLPTSRQSCPTCHATTDRLIVVRGLVVALDCVACTCQKVDKMRSFARNAPTSPKKPSV